MATNDSVPNDREEFVTKVVLGISTRVIKICEGLNGIENWTPLWAYLDLPSRRLLDALDEYENGDGGENKVTARAKELMEVWRRAAEEYRRVLSEAAARAEMHDEGV